MHDRNGVPLKSGDVVLVEAVVGTVYGSRDGCNVTLQIGYDQATGPANVQSSVTLNTRQVLIFKRAETIVPVPVVLAEITPAVSPVAAPTATDPANVDAAPNAA